jgi:protein-disulfide isomerase
MAEHAPQPDTPIQVDARTDYILGNIDAPVTLVEFGDLECPSCKQAQPVLLLLRERHAHQARFVFRHFPLAEVHPHAFAAAEAAEAAGAQGKFWEYVDLLFERQAHLNAADLEADAEQLGLDMGRFRNEIQAHTYGDRVRAQIALGNRLRVRATPTFYLNGTLVDVSYGLQQLYRAVEAACTAES